MEQINSIYEKSKACIQKFLPIPVKEGTLNIIVGLTPILAIWLFFGLRGSPIIANILGSSLPLVASIGYIEQNPQSANVVVYWMIFGLFTLVDAIHPIVQRITCYYLIKVVILIYLMPIMFNGAQFLYDYTHRLIGKYNIRGSQEETDKPIGNRDEMNHEKKQYWK